MKKNGSTQANPSVLKKTVRKMLIIPFCAYFVQISTTFLLSAMLAFSAVPSSLMFALMISTTFLLFAMLAFLAVLSSKKNTKKNTTAQKAPVDTACVEAPVNQ